MRRRDDTPSADNRAAAAGPATSCADDPLTGLVREALGRARTPARRAFLRAMLRAPTYGSGERPPGRPRLPPKG
jgi:hypothetical protein